MLQTPTVDVTVIELKCYNILVIKINKFKKIYTYTAEAEIFVEDLISLAV